MNVIITGATKGIGLAIAEKFAAEGFNLALNARNVNDLKSLKKTFTEKFIKLSRDVHFLNDDRAKIKLEINNLTGSKIKEIKEYTSY